MVLTLQRQGVAFRSLTEQMETTTPHGAFLFSLFGALAQYERALTQERITAGLAAAKKGGAHTGAGREPSAPNNWRRSWPPCRPAPAKPRSAEPLA